MIIITEKENMKENIQKKKWFNRSRLYIWSFLPLLFSHHPNCSQFNGHTIKIKNIRLCIGCFVGYPTALISIVLIGFFNLHKLFPQEILFLFGISFLSTFILSILNLTRNKIIKIFQKFLVGLGSAMIFWWIMTLPNPEILNLIISFMTLIILVVLLNIYHTYGSYKMCKKCDTPFAWSSCEGFELIREKLYKYDLNNIFESFDEFSKKILLKREEKEKDV